MHATCEICGKEATFIHLLVNTNLCTECVVLSEKSNEFLAKKKV